MLGTGKLSGLTNKTYDITALGEAIIDFTEAGRSASGARLFEQNPGGAPANMLSAASRFGAKTAFIGKVGDDMHGRYLKSTLDAAKVDTRGMLLASNVFTTMAFVSLDGGERSFSFARKPGADTRLTVEEVDYDIIDNTEIFHCGSLSLTDEPARSAVYAALNRAKNAGAIISYDPNYRAMLWSSHKDAIAQMRGPLPFVDIIKLSEEEAVMLSGCNDVHSAAVTISSKGLCITVVTMGEKGAIVCSRDKYIVVPGYNVKTVDTTGAGDAFWGAFICKLLESGKSLVDITLKDLIPYARFANAAAAVCVSRRGGILSLPSLAETEFLMKDQL